MKIVIWAAGALLTMMTGSCAEALKVSVLDGTSRPEPLLREAVATAGYIMRKAGIGIDWRICVTDSGCGGFSGDELRVRFVNSRGLHGLKETGACGVSQWSYLALVIVDRVDLLARGREWERGILFGIVIAHELGHLLLGPDEHSVAGIMQARWRTDDFDRAAQGLLLFHPNQESKMRTAAHVRALRQFDSRVDTSASAARLPSPLIP